MTALLLTRLTRIHSRDHALLMDTEEWRKGTGWEEAFYDKPSLEWINRRRAAQLWAKSERPANPLLGSGLTGHERKHQQRRLTCGATLVLASLEDRPPTHGSRSASLPSIPDTRARGCRGIPSSRACFDVPLAERLPATICIISMIPRGTTEEARQARRHSA